jgi:hypothetical protein
MGGTAPAAWDGYSLLPFVRHGARPPIGWRNGGHYEFDFRNVTAGHVSGGIEDQLGITLHESALSVLHNFEHGGTHYKFVYFAAEHVLPPLLFDLDCDPAERCDLATSAKHGPVVLYAMRQLLSHRMVHAEHELTHMQLTPTGAVAEREPVAGTAMQTFARL